MYSKAYEEQFVLLLKILPCLQGQNKLILKGGTAINLFYRDFPRISVDIDLTYNRIEDRTSTISNMNQCLDDLAISIKQRLGNVHISRRLSQNREYTLKLMIANKKTFVKIEPNFIFRGTIFDANNLTVSKKVTETFKTFIADIPTASFCDVFAGKICATLNRQHPRDLFDVKLLLENDGLTDLLRQTVVVYLACDSRPINELLNPNQLDISHLYASEFKDMTMEPVSLAELLQVRTTLISKLITSLTQNERNFLLSVKKGEPDYSLLAFENLEHLPALKWKIINVHKMDRAKHSVMLDKLKKVLGV